MVWSRAPSHCSRSARHEGAFEAWSAERTLRRAKGRLGVLSDKGDFKGGWAWVLPKAAKEAQEGHSLEHKDKAILGESGRLREDAVTTAGPHTELEFENDEREVSEF